MGCNEAVDTECYDDEKPGRTVDVDTFKIDKTEVRVGDYARCVSAKACSTEGVTTPFYEGQEQPEFAEFCNWQRAGRENHPMNCVNWDQARAYCEWVGKRLPTEAEWEKAARGTDGRKYPWGNAGYGGGGKVANIADESAGRRYPAWPVAKGYDDGYVGTAPVGSFPMGESPTGALDMIGNVWEWTADALEGGRVFRGASWDADPQTSRVSTRRRRDADRRGPAVGFRCAR
jgi:formylglycine-generating enzyme required for sulfatase activity